jgi:hypothetical protein
MHDLIVIFVVLLILLTLISMLGGSIYPSPVPSDHFESYSTTTSAYGKITVADAQGSAASQHGKGADIMQRTQDDGMSNLTADHRTTYNLAWPIVQRRAREVWMMHSWPYCYHYQQPQANMYVGIDWSFKQQLLECYNSYLTKCDIEKIKTLNQMWGHKSGSAHAEAFEILYKYVG